MANRNSRTLFLDRLQRLHRRTLLRVGWYGLARVIGVGGSLLMVTAWLLGAAHQPAPFVTFGLLGSLGAALLALVWNNLLGRLWRMRRREQLVRILEQRGYFSNLLIAGEEALRLTDRWNDSNDVAIELRGRLLRRGANLLDTLGPADAVPINRIRQTWLAVAACLLLTVTFATNGGDTLDRGWKRLWNPWSLWSDPPTGGLYAVDQTNQVVAGHGISLAALDATGEMGSAVCEIRIGSGLWQSVPVHRVALPLEKPTLKPPFRKWVADLESVQEDFQWRFKRGAIVTATNDVAVRYHPLITRLEGSVHPPAYTRLAVREMPRMPTWIEVPTGSRLKLKGTTNHPLQGLSMVNDDGDTTDLVFSGRQFSGELAVDQSLAFRLVLVDSFGLGNLEPLRYEVVAGQDGLPSVDLVRTDDDGVLPIHGQVELVTDAADDYGLSRLDVGLRVLNGQGGRQADDFAPLTLWKNGNLKEPGADGWLDWETHWGLVRLQSEYLSQVDGTDKQPLQTGMNIAADFNRLDLLPGDILELRCEVWDNRRPGPAGSSLSPVLKLSLPSAADVLAAQADSSQERRSELEEMRRRGRQLGADLDRLARELLKNPVPDWARQQEMEAAMQRQKKMQEELARVAEALQKDVDRLASGQMTSEKMLDKAEEVSQLLDPSASEELNQMMKQMENSDGKLTPEELAEAMKDVAKDQKEMARRLDAALAMLQSMDREQEMEGLASLLEKMIRKQQELADLSRQLAEENKEASESSDNSETSETSETSENSESSESSESSDSKEENQSGEENASPEDSGSSESPQGDSSDQESPDAEELARRQEALAEEMEQLREKLEEALANLEEQNAEKPTPGSEEMQQALEEALEKMDQQDSKQNMDDASEQLAQMDPEMAAKLQQQALRDMGALYHVILKTQSAMQAAMDQNQVSSLRQLAADMLILSARQEEIALRIPARIRDVRTLDLTRSQHRVQLAAIGVRDRLSELVTESPTRIMRLLGKLDEVIETMGSSVNALEENRAATARTASTSSLAQANRMVIGLLTEAQMNSSGGGAGQKQQQQMSLSEQLKSMAKDQAELNAMTEAMRQMLANRGISQQTRSQMKRLGEGQGELAGRMQELAEEARKNPEGDRILGDLGALGEMMETLGEEVEQGLVSEETLIRQERILSRMLDARNSVRQRDYSSRRESRTARQLYDPEGGRLGGELDAEADDPFNLRYQPLEKAPLEYRGLVRRYFQALEKLRENRARETEVP